MKATEDTLRQLITNVNQLTGMPYHERKPGSMEANPGAFFLKRTNSGYLLAQMLDAQGNNHDIFQLGGMTKKELYGCITGFIIGIERGKQ